MSTYNIWYKPTKWEGDMLGMGRQWWDKMTHLTTLMWWEMSSYIDTLTTLNDTHLSV